MNPATITAPAPPGGVTPAGQPAPVMPSVPFTRASIEHLETFLDWSSVISAVSQPVQGGAVDIPAYGYMRSILLDVTATGGTGSAAVYRADAPYNVIQEVSLVDVNGAPIVGPIGGYSLYLINKYGGYSFNGRPDQLYTYVTPTTAGNFSFMLRIPVEIARRDALGTLPNMNASQTFKLKITMAPNTSVYSTNPTGAPTVRFRAALEAWAPPAGLAPGGAVQAVQPPALGTTQFWSEFTTPQLAAGAQTIRFSRVGGLIRNFFVIFRDTSTPAARLAFTSCPDPLNLYWDGRLVEQAMQNVRLNYMSERYGYATAVLDAGVFAYDLTHDFDGKPGDELRDLWYQTAQSTRLELQLTTLATGTITILTNDVTPNGNVFLS